MTDSNTIVCMLGGSMTEWNHSEFGIFAPRDDGFFHIPAEAVPEAQRAGLVIANDPAPTITDAIPLIVAIGSEAATVDLTSVEMRTRLIELCQWANLIGKGYAIFTDSAGAKFTLDVREARHLVSAACRRQHAAP